MDINASHFPGYAAQAARSQPIASAASTLSGSNATKQDEFKKQDKTEPPKKLFGFALPEAYKMKKLTDLKPSILKEQGIKVLFMDWDNTFALSLTTDVKPEYKKWLKSVQKEGIKVLALSNDLHYRQEIKDLCADLGIEHIHNAKKPFAHVHILKACKENNVSIKQVALADENFATGGLQACFTPGLRYFWPEPIDKQDPGEHWLWAKTIRSACEGLFGWVAKPL